MGPAGGGGGTFCWEILPRWAWLHANLQPKAPCPLHPSHRAIAGNLRTSCGRSLDFSHQGPRKGRDVVYERIGRSHADPMTSKDQLQTALLGDLRHVGIHALICHLTAVLEAPNHPSAPTFCIISQNARFASRRHRAGRLPS